MTQWPTQNPYAYDTGLGDEGEPRNGIGLAGFVVSLASIVTCGIVAPIGLILSIVGLFRKPKGFAIAGTIIGAILSLFGVGAILVGLLMASMWQQGKVVALGTAEVQKFHSANGRLPTDQEFAQLLSTAASPLGGVKVAYRYEIVDAATAKLRLPGFDKTMDTHDDIVQFIPVTAPPSPPQVAPAPAGSGGSSSP